MKGKLIRLFKTIISGIALFFISGIISGQQVPMYSQYIMNGFLVNPSFTGRDGYTTVNLTVREQWVGMAGSPSTYAASFQTRLLKNSYISKSTSVKKKLVKPTKGGKVGVGGYLFNDNNGIMRRTGFQAMYAYHISMGRTEGMPNNLAFGLAMTGYQYYVNTEGLIYEPNDPLINSYDRSVFITDFNFGASFTTSRYYAGFAMTNLLRGNLIFGDTSRVDRNELGHFFLTGGMKFPLNADWTLEPSGFIKSSDMLFKSIQMDLTGRVYYKNDYWAGLSYRTGDAIILMLGLKYDRFYFAYAIDFTLTDIRSSTYGTHEITMAVKFGESARRYRWINAY
ncbi:MAG TPA: PorP/SprF family type IX secretion system membrane protein [Bacteroidales bacterium]|nr:PorP/SprF family type IX secretion system membrane protein [Bacteroidales bacterium]